MPKKPRYALAPGIVHVTARGNRRADIFTAERDVRRLEEFLEDALRRFGVTCHALCLMPNHLHFVLETETIEALSATMERVNGRYGQWFNCCYGFTGHVFQGRYGAVAAQSDSHALELVRYVFLNPVRAGFCARPAAWPWSSYLATIGAAEKPRYLTVEWILGLFADDTALARERLKNFVAEGIVPPAAVARRPLSRELPRGSPRVMPWEDGPPPVPSRA